MDKVKEILGLNEPERFKLIFEEIQKEQQLLYATAKILQKIHEEVFSRALDEEAIEYALTKMEDFYVYRMKPILSRNIGLGSDCLLRVMVAFNQPCKLAVVINGQGAWLNQGNELKENCAYVFDIPVKPLDSVNFLVDFDEQLGAIKCLFIRLFEVR